VPWLGQTDEASFQTPFTICLHVSEEVWALRPRRRILEVHKTVNYAQSLRFFADFNAFYFFTSLFRLLLNGMVQHKKSKRFNLIFVVHFLLIAQSQSSFVAPPFEIELRYLNLNAPE
jgi:hypothetical protein